MAKRGFFAEMHYQAQLAEKRRRQQEAAAIRLHNAALKEQERAEKAAQRALLATSRAYAAERKAVEREAQRLHTAAQEAVVAAKNAELAATYDAIDSLLQGTLEVDDHVDLESLRVTVEHPGFQPGKLAEPLPAVEAPTLPARPVYKEPGAPQGLSSIFGGKKRHADAVEVAQNEHLKAVQAWNAEVASRESAHKRNVAARQRMEQDRLLKLAQAQSQYEMECAQRESVAQESNEALTKLMNDLAFDVPEAIEEYVGIVLSNSVYPEVFPVEYDYSFDLPSRELSLWVLVPEPAMIPSVKEYKYVKSKDEITSTSLPVKAQKERYSSAVFETAIRTLHEVFEADRTGKIHSVALKVGVNRIAPATGLPETVPLVQVAAGRETFTAFDLSNVVAQATLAHLGASLSKSPFDLTPADTGQGVRQRSQ